MGFVKDKMTKWSESNPQEAADRTCARARAIRLGRMVQNVSGLFTDANLERAAAVVVEQLEATMPIVVNGPQEVEDKKVVNTGQRVEYVPDNKARMDAAKFVTAMVEGLPVARQMVINGDFKDLDADQRDVLLGSSAVLEALDDLGPEEVSVVPLLENESTSE